MDQPKDNSIAEEFPTESGNEAEGFSTTQWSVILEAGLVDDSNPSLALEKLCSRYWSPVYAIIHRQFKDAHEAEDLTQAFFARLISHEILKKVDRRKGKFREFLKLALADFLTLKKSRGFYEADRNQVISLNEVPTEVLDQHQSIDSIAPGKIFDQGWALAVLQATLDRLREEYSVDRKTELFERLKPGLTGKADPGWYAVLAAEMHMNEGAIRVAMYRLRRRFGELLRKEIGRTVVDPTEIDEEIRHLFSVIEIND